MVGGQVGRLPDGGAYTAPCLNHAAWWGLPGVGLGAIRKKGRTTMQAVEITPHNI